MQLCNIFSGVERRHGVAAAHPERPQQQRDVRALDGQQLSRQQLPG